MRRILAISFLTLRAAIRFRVVLVMAILLLGGDKTIDNRWYDKAVPRADKIYDARTSKL